MASVQKFAKKAVMNQIRHIERTAHNNSNTDIDESKINNKKTLNIAFLGALSKHLDVDPEKLLAVALRYLPEKVHEVNRAAFQIGREGK